jgi:hypothetical protein
MRACAATLRLDCVAAYEAVSQELPVYCVVIQYGQEKISGCAESGSGCLSVITLIDTITSEGRRPLKP